ncbi:MAG TPA: hypothetical protein H9717_05270 [Candidatus Eisenbergiella merdipullorum]|uniref:Uncharacterized protein n=1 Tax=Candidatus Eisenbergiella merdipullorum TaxID=2838553 RepID=A0A9D2I6E5_9FIRM|nr:hypothetical protein [Candidatus Eisenbergiella merdipullorum]
MYYDTQSSQRPEHDGKRNVWKIILFAVLLLCALPVLIPLSLCAAGGILVVALCVAGAALAAILAVAGGLLGLGFCGLGGLLFLAGMQLAALIGIGFGAVLIFLAPASGLAILGASLLITGAGVLCWLALWQIIKLLVKGFPSLVNWVRRMLFERRMPKRRKMQTAEDAHEATMDGEEVRKGAGYDE